MGSPFRKRGRRTLAGADCSRLSARKTMMESGGIADFLARNGLTCDALWIGKVPKMRPYCSSARLRGSRGLGGYRGDEEAAQ
jgi:hypothetical protein